MDSFLRIQNKHTESTGVVLPRDSRMGPCVQTPIPNIDKKKIVPSTQYFPICRKVNTTLLVKKLTLKI